MEFCGITADLGRSLNTFWSMMLALEGKIEGGDFPKLLDDTAYSSTRVALGLNKLLIEKKAFYKLLGEEKFRLLRKGHGSCGVKISVPIDHPISGRPRWLQATNGWTLKDVPFQTKWEGSGSAAFGFDLAPWEGESRLSAKEWREQPVFGIRFPYGNQYESFKFPPWKVTNYMAALRGIIKGEIRYKVKILDLVKMMRNKLSAHNDDVRYDGKIDDVLLFLIKDGPFPIRFYLYLLMLAFGREAYRVAVNIYKKEKHSELMPDIVEATMPNVIDATVAIPIPHGTRYAGRVPPLVEIHGVE